MAKFAISLEGDKRLERALRTLGGRETQRAVEGALDYAATPIVTQAKKNVRRRSGLTAKSLGKKRIRHRKGGGATVIIGARTSITGEVDGRPHMPAKTAHLLEQGHINSDGSHTPPYPFLGPAFKESEQEVGNRMTRRLRQNIDKAATRAAAGR
jgi:HK97 gp10 family phage protein